MMLYRGGGDFKIGEAIKAEIKSLQDGFAHSLWCSARTGQGVPCDCGGLDIVLTPEAPKPRRWIVDEAHGNGFDAIIPIDDGERTTTIRVLAELPPMPSMDDLLRAFYVGSNQPTIPGEYNGGHKNGIRAILKACGLDAERGAKGE